MALPDLTGQNIQDTYQRVLQVDDGSIRDGTGSLFLPPSASYAITASHAISASHEITYELSSSYAQTASMASGDFLVQGNITASGNISSSLTGSFKHLKATTIEGNSPLTLRDIAEINFNNADLFGNTIFHSDVNVYDGAAFLDEYDHEFFRSYSTGQGVGHIQLGGLGVKTQIHGNNNITLKTNTTISGSTEITGSLTVEGSLIITGSQLITEDITSSGTLRAKVKSFDIEHPTKPGKRLVYGALEGPEHGVYCRGRANELKVKLPPEWSKLIVPSTITVQISSAGKFQPIYFKELISNWLYFGCDSDITEYDFFWEIKGARADVPKLKTTQ